MHGDASCQETTEEIVVEPARPRVDLQRLSTEFHIEIRRCSFLRTNNCLRSEARREIYFERVVDLAEGRALQTFLLFAFVLDTFIGLSIQENQQRLRGFSEDLERVRRFIAEFFDGLTL